VWSSLVGRPSDVAPLRVPISKLWIPDLPSPATLWIPDSPSPATRRVLDRECLWEARGLLTMSLKSLARQPPWPFRPAQISNARGQITSVDPQGRAETTSCPMVGCRNPPSSNHASNHAVQSHVSGDHESPRLEETLRRETFTKPPRWCPPVGLAKTWKGRFSPTLVSSVVVSHQLKMW
jgi:hypothetical protein